MQLTCFDTERRELHSRMAEAYLKFLKFTFLDNAGDTKLQKGLSEARNKFLSNYYIENFTVPECFPEKVFRRYKGSSTKRYLAGDYYSVEALEVLRECKALDKRLRFEHVVPKAAFIQAECEKRILDTQNSLTASDIKDLLDRYWHIAVILREQDGMLVTKNDMPAGWATNNDIFARYKNVQGLLFKLLRTIEDAVECKSILENGQHTMYPAA